MNRRALLAKGPAALALALLPTCLARRTKAIDPTYGWIPNKYFQPLPPIEESPAFVGYGNPFVMIGEDGPEVIRLNTTNLVTTGDSWERNRWLRGPVTITFTDGRVKTHNGEWTIE